MNVAGGPYQGIVGDYVEPERVGRASSWMSVHQFSGSVVGLVLTTLLHGAALGVALAACLAAGWWLTDSYVARLPRTRDVAAPLRIDRNMWTVLVSRAFINVGFYTLFGFLFFFVRESLHVADARTTTGILFLAFTIAGVIGAAVAGRPADRLDKRVVVSVACAAIAIAVGAFAAAPTFAVALACAIGSGAAWGAFFTADWAIAYAVLPRAALASAMGVWNLAVAIPADRGAGDHSARRDVLRRAQSGARPARRARLRDRGVRDRHGVAVAAAHAPGENAKKLNFPFAAGFIFRSNGAILAA